MNQWRTFHGNHLSKRSEQMSLHMSPYPHLLTCASRRLGLGEPECHVHGAVQVNGSGEFGMGLLPLARLRVEGAETQVAVRLQWAHAEFLGQNEGLTVM